MYHGLSRVVLFPLLLTASMAVFSNSNNAVPVTDLENPLQPQAAVVQLKVQSAAQVSVQNANTQLFDIIEMLQQDLQQLRGQVEELTFNLKRLKSDQKQRYLDLDRRIVSLSSPPQDTTTRPPSVATFVVASAVDTQVSEVAPSNASVVVLDPEAEKVAYKVAFNLIRERQYEAAISAFETFIVDYPQGILVGNAHYWLGEVYMVQGDVGAAAISFDTVINDFSSHRKLPDALYKAGLAYQTIDAAKSTQLLERVIRDHPNSSAARLANGRVQ
jgi:tol-pal system protein YbgF